MKNYLNMALVITLVITTIACSSDNKGIVITTEQLEKMDTLVFHKLEDWDKLNLIEKDSLPIKKR